MYTLYHIILYYLVSNSFIYLFKNDTAQNGLTHTPNKLYS